MPYHVEDPDFARIVAVAQSKMDIARSLNYNTSGNNWKMFDKRINRLNLKTSHFGGWRHRKRTRWTVNNAFILASRASNATLIRLIRDRNLIPYQCTGVHGRKCSIGADNIWLGDLNLTLELDHINGDRHDARLSNLRFLCPNCHSLTDTNGGSNIKFRTVRKLTSSDVDDIVAALLRGR